MMEKQTKGLLYAKLAKAKLNKSRRDRSSRDSQKLCEAKNIRLRRNNETLARALADQRKIAQSWFNEVVTLRANMQDVQEKLLRYQMADQGQYEEAVATEVNRRLKEISQPLENGIKSCLDNVLSLVDNITKVKKISGSIAHLSKDFMAPSSATLSRRYNRRNSRLSGNLNPPLGSNSPKSPRRNIVRPMVEGHTLQPATINISRISLQDQRMYRLAQRAEIREEADVDMSIINEQTPDNSSTLAADTSRDDINVDGAEVSSSVMLVEDDEDDSSQSELMSADNSSDVQDLRMNTSMMPTMSNDDSTPTTSRKRRSRHIKSSGASQNDDPLEGSSWMSREAKPRRSSSYLRTSNICLVLDPSSDSEEELDEEAQADRTLRQNKKLRLSHGRNNIRRKSMPTDRRKTIHKMNITKVISSSPSVTIISSPVLRKQARKSMPGNIYKENLPIIRLVKVDNKNTSNVGRRAKRTSGAALMDSSQPSNSSIFEANHPFSNPSSLPSFIIADDVEINVEESHNLNELNQVKTNRTNDSTHNSPTRLDPLPVPTVHPAEVETPNSSTSLHNYTCHENLNMDMTLASPTIQLTPIDFKVPTAMSILKPHLNSNLSKGKMVHEKRGSSKDDNNHQSKNDAVSSTSPSKPLTTENKSPNMKMSKSLTIPLDKDNGGGENLKENVEDTLSNVVSHDFSDGHDIKIRDGSKRVQISVDKSSVPLTQVNNRVEADNIRGSNVHQITNSTVMKDIGLSKGKRNNNSDSSQKTKRCNKLKVIEENLDAETFHAVDNDCENESEVDPPSPSLHKVKNRKYSNKDTTNHSTKIDMKSDTSSNDNDKSDSKTEKNNQKSKMRRPKLSKVTFDKIILNDSIPENDDLLIPINDLDNDFITENTPPKTKRQKRSRLVSKVQINNDGINSIGNAESNCMLEEPIQKIKTQRGSMVGLSNDKVLKKRTISNKNSNCLTHNEDSNSEGTLHEATSSNGLKIIIKKSAINGNSIMHEGHPLANVCLDKKSKIEKNIPTNKLISSKEGNSYTEIHDEALSESESLPIFDSGINSMAENVVRKRKKVAVNVKNQHGMKNDIVDCDISDKYDDPSNSFKDPHSKNKFFTVDQKFETKNVGENCSVIKVPTLFDLSLMDATVPIEPYKGKTAGPNIIPELNSSIKDVSVVMTDVMLNKSHDRLSLPKSEWEIMEQNEKDKKGTGNTLGEVNPQSPDKNLKTREESNKKIGSHFEETSTEGSETDEPEWSGARKVKISVFGKNSVEPPKRRGRKGSIFNNKTSTLPGNVDQFSALLNNEESDTVPFPCDATTLSPTLNGDLNVSESENIQHSALKVTTPPSSELNRDLNESTNTALKLWDTNDPDDVGSDDSDATIVFKACVKDEIEEDLNTKDLSDGTEQSIDSNMSVDSIESLLELDDCGINPKHLDNLLDSYIGDIDVSNQSLKETADDASSSKRHVTFKERSNSTTKKKSIANNVKNIKKKCVSKSQKSTSNTKVRNKAKSFVASPDFIGSSDTVEDNVEFCRPRKIKIVKSSKVDKSLKEPDLNIVDNLIESTESADTSINVLSKKRAKSLKSTKSKDGETIKSRPRGRPKATRAKPKVITDADNADENSLGSALTTTNNKSNGNLDEKPKYDVENAQISSTTKETNVELEAMEINFDGFVESDQPRRRRAAANIKSLKERSVGAKLRRN